MTTFGCFSAWGTANDKDIRYHLHGYFNHRHKRVGHLYQGRYASMKGEMVGQSVLGGSSFLDFVREEFLEAFKDRERPSVKGIHIHAGKETIIKLSEDQSFLQNKVLLMVS